MPYGRDSGHHLRRATGPSNGSEEDRFVGYFVWNSNADRIEYTSIYPYGMVSVSTVEDNGNGHFELPVFHQTDTGTGGGISMTVEADKLQYRFYNWKKGNGKPRPDMTIAYTRLKMNRDDR